MATIDNKKCALVQNGTRLFCTELATQRNQMVNLTSGSAPISSYSGNVTIPSTASGSSGYKDLLAVYELTPLFKMAISNFTSGELLRTWTLSTPGKDYARIDLKHGLVMTPSPSPNKSAEIRSLHNGTILLNISSEISSAEFGEVDGFLYYADLTNDDYRYIEVTPGTINATTNPNCRVFSYTLLTCEECLPGFSYNTTSKQCATP